MPDGAMRKTLSRRFSAAASTYDDHARVQWAIAQSVAERARTYLPPPARVLDIGCGTGAVIQALGPAYERVGLDLSEAMIAQASKLHTDDIEWVHTDVLDYTDERPFDGFLSASTLHWIRPLD
ncbi:MAG: ubiquinone/menaquinone biosynthesis C-methylase UbiE, partial [Verrucomicrobiales bacterium]